MHNTMFNGQLAGLVAMDTIATRPHSYGLGPLEYLRGELLLLDGHCYVSHATSDSTMVVQERSDVKAPFFVQQQVKEWRIVVLPDSVTDLGRLDTFLTAWAKDRPDAFAFRLTGRLADARLHVVDLPPGSAVRSPDDAHQGQKSYALKEPDAELLGLLLHQAQGRVYPPRHNIHVHLITTGRQWMGHLEDMHMDPRRVVLYIAE